MKKKAVEVLKKALKKKGFEVSEQEIESKLEIPPSYEMGDYAFPCFFLAQKFKAVPHEIAIELRKEIGNIPEMYFQEIQVSGPYINFFVNRKALAQQVIWKIINKRERYGTKRFFFGFRKKIVVEFSSPNIAKKFGIGHLRSTIIGNSIANICASQGFKVTRVNYPGDWGTQFGKLIFGFKQWGSLDKLEKHPLDYLEKLYVKVSKDKHYEDFSRYWFKQLEEGNPDAVALWRAFRELSLEEFEQMYKDLGIKFDDYIFESNYNKKMNSIVVELTKKGLIKESEGALIVDLSEYGLGVALIQKKDGATLYITRDLASAIERYKKYRFTKMIYEVGQEQELHFKQVFKILELMGYEWAKECVHASHGLYLDDKGKKFSTRKGKVVYVKDILEETKSLAKKEIKKRVSRISNEELESRASKVARAAIFYGDLKNNRSNNIVFDIDAFVSFEGDTGPYIQYSYARASSILRKAQEQRKFEIKELHPKEFALVKKLDEYPIVLDKAFHSLNPALIANYAFQLAQTFNEFYHECPVIGMEEESFRLSLVEAFRQVIRNSLHILGIDVLEEM